MASRLEGRASPGPVYLTAPACRKQALSTKRSMPSMVFSRADRFNGFGSTMPSGSNPGPGEYVA